MEDGGMFSCTGTYLPSSEKLFATIFLVLNNIKLDRGVNIKTLHAHFLVSLFSPLVSLLRARAYSAMQNASLT